MQIELFDSELGSVCAVLPAFLLFAVRPKLITPRAIDFLNVYMTTIHTMQTWASGNLFFDVDKGHVKNWSLGARLYQCVLCGNVTLSILVQIVSVVIEVVLLD